MRHIRLSFFVLLLFSCAFSALATEENAYQIGRGYKFSDALIVGGYFSTEYGQGDEERFFEVDDIAVLVYGALGTNFSYLAELEWSKIYTYDFKNDEEVANTDPIVERLYGDFTFSDNFSLRFGKQISPIGYWNLQPINVLRETTSNPILSRRMFPKFLTGLDLYGYTSFDENLKYHIYLQATEDLDNNRINIDVDKHFGITLEKDFLNKWKVGGSAGAFVETNQDKTRYLQLNARFDSFKYSLIAESNLSRKKIFGGKTQKVNDIYVQAEYRFKHRHILLTRLEYFNNDKTGLRERIGILGYGYRYQYPISFKVEYQWHADSQDNRVLTSFSVLF